MKLQLYCSRQFTQFDLTEQSLPSDTSRFNFIGDDNVLRPDVVLPLARPHDATDNTSGVNSNSHVDVDLPLVSQLSNIADHTYPQIDTVFRVSFVFYRKAAYAVIAIAQKLYAQYIMFL